jgi:hypothetical protein
MAVRRRLAPARLFPATATVLARDGRAHRRGGGEGQGSRRLGRRAAPGVGARPPGGGARIRGPSRHGLGRGSRVGEARQSVGARPPGGGARVRGASRHGCLARVQRPRLRTAPRPVRARSPQADGRRPRMAGSRRLERSGVARAPVGTRVPHGTVAAAGGRRREGERAASAGRSSGCSRPGKRWQRARGAVAAPGGKSLPGAAAAAVGGAPPAAVGWERGKKP